MSRTMGPREVKSTSRVYVAPGMRSVVVIDSWVERRLEPVAAEASANTRSAASATPMMSLRTTRTTRRQSSVGLVAAPFAEIDDGWDFKILILEDEWVLRIPRVDQAVAKL